MNSIKITCNSPRSIIVSKASTYVIKHILDHSFQWDTKILRTYKKIKNLEPIELEEKDIFIKLIESNEFKNAFDDLKQDYFEYSDKKSDILSYNALLQELNTMMVKCRIIDVLENWDGVLVTDDIEYFEVLNHVGKKKYYQKIEDQGDYIYARDIRSDKYVLLQWDDVLIESVAAFTVSHEGNGLCMHNGDSNYMILSDDIIPFTQWSHIIETQYAHCICDIDAKRLIKIDKTTEKISYIDFSWQELLEIIWNYILVYSRGEKYIEAPKKKKKKSLWSRKEKRTAKEFDAPQEYEWPEYHDGEMYLYSIFKNKRVLSWLNFQEGSYKVDNNILKYKLLWTDEDQSFDCAQ